MNNLKAFGKDKLEILDIYMLGEYDFIKQDQEKINDIITNKDHPKYSCSNIIEKYTYFEKWLKSFFKRFKNTNPSMYFMFKWKHYSIIKIKNNEDLESFIKHMLETEELVVSERFLKNIALSQFELEGAEILTDENTNEEYYFPMIIATFNNYQNIIKEINDDEDVTVNIYSIFATGLRQNNFIFSIENLNVENLKLEETDQKCEIETMRKGINILKEHIKRTCNIRRIRIHKL